MLGFPNSCRSFDQTRHVVRFWGHESAMEAAFFIDESALRRLDPDLQPTEDSFLHAFDTHLAKIHLAATKLHARARKWSYDLTAADFG